MAEREVSSPNEMSWPKVGAQIAYYASPATNPQPATVAADLGSGLYNLRVVDSSAGAEGKLNVKFYGPLDERPSSGPFCTTMASGQPL